MISFANTIPIGQATNIHGDVLQLIKLDEA
jgi:hypothetical protein